MQDRFEYLYDRLNGFIMEEESEGIPNLFDGEYGRLYGLAYDARVRISKALDGNLDGENADALIIVECHEKMTQIICEKMYEYGYADGSGFHPFPEIVILWQKHSNERIIRAVEINMQTEGFTVSKRAEKDCTALLARKATANDIIKKYINQHKHD